MPKKQNPEIQLQEINSNKFPIPPHVSSSEDDDVEYIKPTTKFNSSESIDQLPPLSTTVNVSDILFNFVVFLIVCINLTVDIVLIFYHYVGGYYWGSAITAICVSSGGVALLGQFWGVTYEQLHRIYTKGNCVRILVNGFPWLATLITTFQTATSSLLSRANPMVTQRYVKLLELSQSFLRVQGFAQGAPQAVVQFVILLENVEDVGGFKATLLLTSITTSVTIMMISNLPLKTDEISDRCRPKAAAYNPCTRVYIGLRMLSSFFSRTISLSVLFSSCRCLIPHLLNSSSGLVSHVIPLAVLLIPRVIFTFVDYMRSKVKSTDVENSSVVVVESRFVDVLVCYVATVFMQFSDPVWVFWYVGVESVAFVAVFVGVEACLGCVGVGVGVACVGAFVLLFFFVPCVVPVVGRVVRGRTGG